MSLNFKKQQANNTSAGLKRRHNVIAIVIVVVTSFNVAYSVPKESTIEPVKKFNELVTIHGSIVNKLISFLVN